MHENDLEKCVRDETLRTAEQQIARLNVLKRDLPAADCGPICQLADVVAGLVFAVEKITQSPVFPEDSDG